jgi:hypothetical protein
VDHLFPFRTEKLSTLAPMVLGFRESRSPPFFRPNLVLLGWVFLCAKNSDNKLRFSVVGLKNHCTFALLIEQSF